MSERLKNFLIAGVTLAMAIALVVLVVTNESPDDRVERLGASIKCPVCQGKAIGDSPAQMATDMMDLIEERVAGGASDQEIIDELLGSFSGAVLLDPPLSGATLLLWLAPGAALVGGVAVVLWWKSHPGGRNHADDRPQATRTRRLVGGLILIGGFGAIVLVAATLLQDRAGPNEGAADVAVEDLDDVSNETMEAVVAANLDNPQINAMRLALAERYFATGDYRSAFPHYLQVAQDVSSTDNEATTALVRLGWMAYDGNGEVDTAITLLDEALQISPGLPGALYLKGQVLWCGAGENGRAVELFEQVLGDRELEGDTRSLVESDLALASAGEPCQ
ncbi:MAG: cytochrome c-type biogenesis protein CcmH [Acidimicrobiia bacterium]